MLAWPGRARFVETERQAPKERSKTSSAPSELEHNTSSNQALPGLANIEGSFGANTRTFRQSMHLDEGWTVCPK